MPPEAWTTLKYFEKSVPYVRYDEIYSRQYLSLESTCPLVLSIVVGTSAASV